MPNVVKSTYAVLPLNQISATRCHSYELKRVDGVCPFTKAVARMNSHDPKADLQHPYGRIENMVADAIDNAEAHGELVEITIQIDSGAGVFTDDVVHILRNRTDAQTVQILDRANTLQDQNTRDNCHVIVLEYKNGA